MMLYAFCNSTEDNHLISIFLMLSIAFLKWISHAYNFNTFIFSRASEPALISHLVLPKVWSETYAVTLPNGVLQSTVRTITTNETFSSRGLANRVSTLSNAKSPDIKISLQ